MASSEHDPSLREIYYELEPLLTDETLPEKFKEPVRRLKWYIVSRHHQTLEAEVSQPITPME